MKKEIDVIDSLQKRGELKMRIYAMLSDSAPNYEYYLKKGIYKTERLNVRSFKFYADGALGSYGACLLKPYSDSLEVQGFFLKNPKYFIQMADSMFKYGFQMNTHCIGDSAVKWLITINANTLNPVKTYNVDSVIKNNIKINSFANVNSRWRIEHYQVISIKDLQTLLLLGKAISSEKNII